VNEPGLFEMDINDYHNDPAPPGEASLNASLVPWLLQCPAKARVRHPKLNPGYQALATRKMDQGTIDHLVMLGKGRNLKIIEADNYRTKAAQEARDAARAAGLIPCLPSDLALAEAMHTAAMKQLEDFGVDNSFEGGLTEIAMLWKDDAGCWGRSLIDRLRNDLPTWEVWDYKTTERCVRPEDAGLGAHIVDMGYDTQIAVQERGLLTLFPTLAGRLRFRLLFQETEEPYLISVVEPDAATMAIARRKVDYAFKLWAECLRTETFPGYTPRVVTSQDADFLASRWINREIADSEREEVEPPPNPRRGPGRPQGSKARPKKRLLWEMRQKAIEEREREREQKQNPLEGG